MPRSKRTRNGRGRSWPAVIAALGLFAAFGCLQMILAALDVHLSPVAPAPPASRYGVALLRTAVRPVALALPPSARPSGAGRGPAATPRFHSGRQLALVAAEDTRIRALLRDSAHARQPTVVAYPRAAPTLVLPGRPAAYTPADLVLHGALTMLSQHVGLLRDNVFVAPGAQLALGAPALAGLEMAGGNGTFTSIVAWGGQLSFTGTTAAPFAITGWDLAAKSPAADRGYGRPYIREIGAAMTLTDVRVSALGFWSGRTGGVAWTGSSSGSSRGAAIDSDFTGDTYGAFVSRSTRVTFSADLFEDSELDGLHIHRDSVGTQVLASAAARNGGNGFLVDRATQDTRLRGDLSEHNGANGFLIDGRPLVSGASASGGSNVPGSGTVLDGSAADGNAHESVLIEGGIGTVVRSGQFCSRTTAVTVEGGAIDTVLTGNYIGCAPRTGISVGPLAPGTVLSGNAVAGPRIGVLLRSTGAVSLYDNRITGTTGFGVYARGGTVQATGVGNVVAGRGVRPVGSRDNAGVSGLDGTSTAGWSHRAGLSFASYLEYHPLASMWLGIVGMILLAAGWSYRRKLPSHPYPGSVRRPHQAVADAGALATASAPQPASYGAGPVRAPAPRSATFRPARGSAPPTTWDLPALNGAGGPAGAASVRPSFQPAAARPREPAPNPPRPAAEPWVYREPRPAAGRYAGAHAGDDRGPGDAGGAPSWNGKSRSPARGPWERGAWE